MAKKILFFFSVIGVLILNSCATLLNSRTTYLEIITSKPSKLVINKDTTKQIATKNSFNFERNNKPISVTAYTDSTSKTIEIKSKNSFAYWLNLYPGFSFLVGFLIDHDSKKRYTYPQTIYIDLAHKDPSYLTYKPLSKPFDGYSNIIKITPFTLLGFSNTGVELSCETKTAPRFSTQFMASYLLPTSVLLYGNSFKPNIRGFRLSIEEKFYFNKSAPLGPYMSVEVNYLKNKYHDIWWFGVRDIYSDTTYNYTNYIDTFGISKQTYSFNLKLGYQYIYKRLAVDCYAGLGLKHKVVTHYDKLIPNDEMEMPRHPDLHYIMNLDGKRWSVSIPFNVRIGWTY